jgi:hypothetical protein
MVKELTTDNKDVSLMMGAVNANTDAAAIISLYDRGLLTSDTPLFKFQKPSTRKPLTELLIDLHRAGIPHAGLTKLMVNHMLSRYPDTDVLVWEDYFAGKYTHRVMSLLVDYPALVRGHMYNDMCISTLCDMIKQNPTYVGTSEEVAGVIAHYDIDRTSHIYLIKWLVGMAINTSIMEGGRIYLPHTIRTLMWLVVGIEPEYYTLTPVEQTQLKPLIDEYKLSDKSKVIARALGIPDIPPPASPFRLDSKFSDYGFAFKPVDNVYGVCFTYNNPSAPTTVNKALLGIPMAVPYHMWGIEAELLIKHMLTYFEVESHKLNEQDMSGYLRLDLMNDIQVEFVLKYFPMFVNGCHSMINDVDHDWVYDNNLLQHLSLGDVEDIPWVKYLYEGQLVYEYMNDNTVIYNRNNVIMLLNSTNMRLLKYQINHLKYADYTKDAISQAVSAIADEDLTVVGEHAKHSYTSMSAEQQ